MVNWRLVAGQSRYCWFVCRSEFCWPSFTELDYIFAKYKFVLNFINCELLKMNKQLMDYFNLYLDLVVYLTGRIGCVY